MRFSSQTVASVLLLLLMYALALNSMLQKSPTFDEQGFLVRGLGYVRAENRHMRVGHPLGLGLLNSMLLWRDDTVQLPTDDPSWQQTGFHRPAELFLWEIGNDVERIMLLGRLPTVWLSLLLAAICSRFAGQVSGSRWAGVLATALVGLDPNVLAHARLATTDFGLTAAALAAAYLLWRALMQPSAWRIVAAAAGFAVLQNTKFTALLFVPLFALVIVVGLLVEWRRQANFPGRRLLLWAGLFPLSTLLALWAMYGFEIGTLPAELPAFESLLAGRTLPLAYYIEQLSDIGGRVQQPTPAFLRGDYSDSGWWYYFPIAFLIKTPLPTLLLLLLALAALVIRRPSALTAAVLLIPALGFFAIALTNEINIGYRHILPVVPFVLVLIAVQLGPRMWHGWTAVFVLPLLLWLLIDTIVIAPDFLTYFNPIAGGPEHGWRWLVDSNIDWGQDLKGLKRWIDENEVEQVRLSYFGEARPEYYGIEYIGLPSVPPRLTCPDAIPYAADVPLAGTYAISVTNLQGPHFRNHDLFARFREMTPRASIGNSILIYDIAPTGAEIPISLGSVQLEELSANDVQRIASNQLVPRWFDASQALLLPDGANALVAAVPGQLQGPMPWSALYAWGEPLNTTGNYTLFRARDGFQALTEIMQPAVDVEFQHESGRIELKRYAFQYEQDQLTVNSLWQQQAEAQPLKMFVHFTDARGNIVAQWDGFGVVCESWLPGDHLLQTSRIALGEDALPVSDGPQQFDVWLGVYHPDTGRRWQTATGDRLLLGTIELP